MYKASLILLALAVVQAIAQDCDTGAAARASSTLSNCVRGPCSLRRGETVDFSLKFTPDSALDDLTSRVSASRRTLNVIFFDNRPICDKIFTVSDDQPASCPLTPGVEYIYRDSLPVPRRPPATRGLLQLSILSGSNIVKCIQVEVRIRR